MNEGQTGRIVLEDKDPEEWKEVYKYIDPFLFPNSRNNLDSDTALRLLHFFDYLQMTDVMRKCDMVLEKEFRMETMYIYTMICLQNNIHWLHNLIG